jgi:hypothetical protein
MKLLITALAAAACCNAAPATTYTADTNIADLTNGITNYATFSNFSSGDVGSPFTPTSAELATNGYRVYGGTLTGTGLDPSNNWILASFTSAVAAIRVFANIDHYGAPYDGYQYRIAGSNDLSTWTDLYDATSVSSAGEPFTLLTSTGTAPTTVNNVITGAGGVGYEADFHFSTAYKYYAFGASTVAIAQGNADQELSAVAAVPEPETYAMALAGLGVIGWVARRARAS